MSPILYTHKQLLRRNHVMLLWAFGILYFNSIFVHIRTLRLPLLWLLKNCTDRLTRKNFARANYTCNRPFQIFLNPHKSHRSYSICVTINITNNIEFTFLYIFKQQLVIASITVSSAILFHIFLMKTLETFQLAQIEDPYSI